MKPDNGSLYVLLVMSNLILSQSRRASVRIEACACTIVASSLDYK